MTFRRDAPLRTTGPAALAAVLLGLAATTATAQDNAAPMSAIDWLSQSVDTAAATGPLPGAFPDAGPAPIPDEPPVADSAAPPEVTVSALDAPSPDGAGVLGPSVTGLPATLWSASDVGTLVTLIRAERVETLPAIQDLIVTLMLAEADPPIGAGPEGALFVARVDRLLDLGALDQAQSLLESVTSDQPEIFRRYFDVTLLTGTESTACAALRDKPGLAPTLPARIFCLARGGDWPAAALTYSTAVALGDLTPEEETLLGRFLDPEIEAEGEPLPPPARPSPLIFRLREAVGESLPTAALPPAFAVADLRTTVAWRYQMEAAERLARRGVLSENVLLGLYSAQRPAASGGVWDRAAAVQAFDAALQSGATRDILTTLPPAWAAMETARTEVPFARLYGERLTALALTGEAGALAFRIALLSPAYETAALARVPADAEEALWQAIARGQPAPGIDAPSSVSRAEAVAAGFAPGAAVPAPLAAQIAEGRLGEALLRAIALFNQGLDSDPAALTDAIATFRSVGLEDIARRAALQALILNRPA